MNEVQNTGATISALQELMAQRAAFGLRPVTDLGAFFSVLSETGFERSTLNALAAGGFWHRCTETGAYTFRA